MDISTEAALARAEKVTASPGAVVGVAGGFRGEILIVTDLFVGLLLIGFSRFVLLTAMPVRENWTDLAGSDTARALCLLSIIAALMLREPGRTAPYPSCLAAGATMMGGRLGAALMLLAATMTATTIRDRLNMLWLVSWLGWFSLWALLRNNLLLAYIRRGYAQHRGREAVAVVGGPIVAGRIASRIAAEADVVAIIDRTSASCNTELMDDDPVGDCFGEVAVLARAGDIDTVIVALEQEEEPEITGLIDRLKALPVQVALCPDPGGGRPGSADLRGLLGLNMAVIAGRPAFGWGRFVKAVIDRLGAAVILTLCLPLMIVIALAIAAESPGPVLFRQRRNGWAGRLFTLYKFRTMHHVEPVAANAGQTRRNDPRCTRVGAYLRRSSLDELPQLWNVIIGDMSLVGPRPHADALHARERAGWELVAEYAQRQRVVPGMTGWAQVHGLRGGITSPEQLRRRVEFDLYYIDHWSLLLDLRILAMTPLAVLRAENAF
jgi:putative colanic acid biosynthesis UDP-glucose lipid carrier transferase